ncbi:transcription repressor OFP7 [Cannabis sativa]|uniref:transcription repressor OFP7 n=1 Tax=Cannabis sativa TaxID=3483 RepID=UPI0029CA557A|nr:transcription repressor OFP7 [Cannabis sativa]
MSKRFKLKFPNVKSFQLCRSKDPSSLPENPKPVIYRPSPVNPKVFDIGYPSTLPAPPPSTPEYSFVMRRAAASSRMKSDGCGPTTCAQYFYSGCSSTELPCCNFKTTSSSAVTEKYFVKKRKNEKKQKRSKARSDYRRDFVSFSSSNDYDEDEDSVVLLDSSRSFSNEVANDEPIIMEIPNDIPRVRSKEKVVEDSRIRRVKSQSNCNTGSSSSSSKNRKGSVKTVPFQGTAGDVVEVTKVRESVAVVKKSDDPYEDFKRSMLEMIMEKQMFEASDLEELLQCFLTLNSRQYHGVIVEAFSEIWDILFCDSPVKQHRLSF